MATGVYVVYRNAATGQECARVGPGAVCFCGHGFDAHASPGGGRCGETSAGGRSSAPCACRRFEHVPRRPEEVGEWWLPRRAGFDVRKWRAKCRCGHGHDEHHPVTRRCVAPGCGGCGAFASAFTCIVCDARWETHETSAEGEEERREAGKPVREDFLPLAEAPDLRPLVYGEAAADGDGGAGAKDDGRFQGLAVTCCTRRVGCPCSACASSAAVVVEEEGSARRGRPGPRGAVSAATARRLRPANDARPPEKGVLLMDERSGGRGGRR